jgi:hypothetical protein
LQDAIPGVLVDAIALTQIFNLDGWAYILLAFLDWIIHNFNSF